MKRLAVVLILITATGVQGLAEESVYIGYRGGGTGVFPADCKPVTSWKEFAGTRKVALDHRRPKDLSDVPDPEIPEVLENIVWKTPLPNMSESSPVVVGKRVFMLCEQLDKLGAGNGNSPVGRRREGPPHAQQRMVVRGG